MAVPEDAIVPDAVERVTVSMTESAKGATLGIIQESRRRRRPSEYVDEGSKGISRTDVIVM